MDVNKMQAYFNVTDLDQGKKKTANNLITSNEITKTWSKLKFLPYI